MAVISNGTTIADAGAFSVSLGSMVLIKTLTASSSSTLSFVHGSSSVVLDSTYPIYLFKFTSIHPSTDGVDFTFQGSTDTGSSYGLTTTSTYFNNYANEAGTATALTYETVADNPNNTGEIELIREEKLSADNDHCGSGELYLFNPSGSTFMKHYLATSQANHAAEYTMNSFIGGYFNTTSAIDAIRFSVNSGNMATGTIKLYGIKDS